MKTMELPPHVLHSSVLTDFDMNKKGEELLRLCNNKHFEISQKLLQSSFINEEIFYVS